MSIVLDMTEKKRVTVPRPIREWKWELNGAGDPSRIWIDQADSGLESRARYAIDAGFETGTWVLRLTLPNDLGEVKDVTDPALIAMGLAGAAKRLEEKLHEAVGLCREQGRTWEVIGLAMGVSRQAAQQRFGSRRD